jgi:hypothetical protein
MAQDNYNGLITVAMLFIACAIFMYYYYSTLSPVIAITMVVVTMLLFSYLVYFLALYIISPAQFQQVGDTKISLSKLTQAASSETLSNAWSSNAGSTLYFYINPTINDRTAQTGNEYANLVQIGNRQNLKILVAPDAGRDIVMAPAIFQVYTKGNAIPENIDIPEFPMQTWTSVIIVKMGRRFNIYMNGKLMVSHVCLAMPDYDETGPLLVGDPRLGGTIEQIHLSPTALNTSEVRDLISKTTDTYGKPYEPTNMTTILSHLTPTLPSSLWCPGGNCTTPKKAGPLEKFVTPYS